MRVLADAHTFRPWHPKRYCPISCGPRSYRGSRAWLAHNFNGELLNVAEAAGFDLLLTTDKGIRYQQNLTSRQITIVVLGNSTWRVVRRYLDQIASVVAGAKPGSYSEVDIPLN